MILNSAERLWLENDRDVLGRAIATRAAHNDPPAGVSLVELALVVNRVIAILLDADEREQRARELPPDPGKLQPPFVPAPGLEAAARELLAFEWPNGSFRDHPAEHGRYLWRRLARELGEATAP